MKNKQRRILIARTDRLGDVVLSTPIPREIKKKYPDAFVGVLVRQYTKPVFENNPHVDVIITDDFTEETRKKTFWESVKELRKYKFTDALMLLPTERLNWMFFYAGIWNRIGVGHKLYQTLSFAKSVSRKKYIPLRHEADYCMDLVRKIGVETDNLSTEIHLSDVEKVILETRKEGYKSGKDILIGIHTTFGGSSPNVTPSVYREVINELKKYSNIKIVITDYDIPDAVKNIEEVIYLRHDIRDFFIDIACLDLLVSSSTGPAHVAAALKVPTLTLFCSLPACSPKLWSPMGNDARYILPEENYCNTKCPGDPKKCSFEGEGGIDAKKILDNIFKFIKERGITPVQF
jgi:ADP-heptose:LPS heptosyltransferase